MREIEYLKTINEMLSDSSLLGDDCAFLPSNILGSSGLYITQDSLVEDVHFSLTTISPYQLGKKSVNVNISDLAAMCAEPLYITISLSLPNHTNKTFVKEFYKGVNEVCEMFNIKVAGGDLTGSDKVFVSICAIGKKNLSFNVSRSFAKTGDFIITTGVHGDSSGGLKLLCEGENSPQSLIDAHLNPIAQIVKSRDIAKAVNEDFAMMDTSDGLADALFKISNDSKVLSEIDFAEIPVSDDLKHLFPTNYKNLVLWGGEDYQLLFCVKKDVYEKLDKKKFFKIGEVKEKSEKPKVIINDGTETSEIEECAFSQKSYNHFGEEKK